MALLKEIGMSPERELRWVIFLGRGIVTSYIRMSRPIKWNVVGGYATVRDAETFDMTHVTGTKAVVALDAHDHGQRRYIPEDKNQISSKWKELRLGHIKDSDSHG